MLIEKNVELSNYTTFGVPAQTSFFSRFASVAELQSLLAEARTQAINILCLGGGSNLLFVEPFPGLVIKNEIFGLELIEETSAHVKVRVGAGIVWHDFVEFCLQRGWGGVENLALIPGTVGAAPIQNIGAYGVEVKEVIETVEVVEVATGATSKLAASECQFGYRDSIFKGKSKGRWIITAVNFVLTKNKAPSTHYGAIEAELKRLQITQPNLRDVATAVMNIRRSKLPDPAVLGNAGSFFKNPIVSASIYHSLKDQYPGLVAYPDQSGSYKLAAGWLIEQSGLKGHREGHCGVHKEQALVLVNYGGATGTDVFALAQKVQRAVMDKFQVALEMEVNIIGRLT